MRILEQNHASKTWHSFVSSENGNSEKSSRSDLIDITEFAALLDYIQLKYLWRWCNCQWRQVRCVLDIACQCQRWVQDNNISVRPQATGTGSSRDLLSIFLKNKRIWEELLSAIRDQSSVKLTTFNLNIWLELDVVVNFHVSTFLLRCLPAPSVIRFLTFEWSGHGYNNDILAVRSTVWPRYSKVYALEEEIRRGWKT